MTLNGRHVLLIGLGFFGLVASVNAGMIYAAITTFSGIETEDAYLRGLAYNEVLEAAEVQATLDWQVEVTTERLDDGRVAVEATFNAKDGLPVRGLDVSAAFTRPTHRGYDQTLALTNLGGGRYGAEVDLPLAGQWDLGLRAALGGEPLFTREQRLWLK